MYIPTDTLTWPPEEYNDSLVVFYKVHIRLWHEWMIGFTIVTHYYLKFNGNEDNTTWMGTYVHRLMWIWWLTHALHAMFVYIISVNVKSAESFSVLRNNDMINTFLRLKNTLNPTVMPFQPKEAVKSSESHYAWILSFGCIYPWL